ncbi:MAG: hypothetical protein ABIM99_01130 [Candidatus Dojkabacteria bacterium]
MEKLPQETPTAQPNKTNDGGGNILDYFFNAALDVVETGISSTLSAVDTLTAEGINAAVEIVGTTAENVLSAAGSTMNSMLPNQQETKAA